LTFLDFVRKVKARLETLMSDDPLSVVGPSFTMENGIARWGRGYQWAEVSQSAETPVALGGHLLVLGRHPSLTTPFGAQLSPIPFGLAEAQVETVAATIAAHFAQPA